MAKSKVYTVPNFLSLLRLLGVPVYFALIENERFGFAVGLLFIAGATDYLDGKIARLFNQGSRLGEILDPAVDRLYILAILLSFLQLDLMPVWIVGVIIARDLLLGLLLMMMRRYGLAPFQVTYLGKAATFNLLYAFPLILLTRVEERWVSDLAFVLGWAFSIWGIALYLLTGFSYAIAGWRAIVQARASRL
ncbi:MAG: CDP-alcohol phosphatidyltransferase family protein [Candidatus Nanopelagicaceae bacterium]|jgi:cardiolipin synthase